MLDLQELIRNNQPMYVRNTTGKFLEKQGPYILEIRDGNRPAARVVIPATKYPFLLSAHVPAKLLGDSTEFYAALSKGILELLDPKHAKREMSDPIAQAVVKAAMRKFQPTRRESRPPPELVTANNRTDRAPPGADRGISGLPTENRTPLQDVTTAATEYPNVNPTILQIVMDLQSDESLKDEKFLELAGMEGLTEEDLGYLLGNCQQSTKIIKWARTELANMVGDDEAAEIEAEQEVAAEVKKSGGARRTRKRRSPQQKEQ